MATRPASLPSLKVHSDGLTEFGPISPRGRGSSGILSRLLGSGVSKARAPPSSLAATQPVQAERVTVGVGSSSNSSLPSVESQSTFYKDMPEYAPADFGIPISFTLGESSSGSSGNARPRLQHRSLRSVMQALSHLMDRKPAQGLKPYKEGDFRQYWMPDSSCKECYDCGDKFTTFRRRHHCRICGQIFCSSCCNQVIPGRVIGIDGNLRACTYCCKVISEYVLDMSGDFGELEEKLKKIADVDITASPSGSRKPSVIVSSTDTNSLRSRNVFDILPTSDTHTSLDQISTEERNLLTKESHQLRTLFAALTSEEGGIPLQSHRHRLRTYTGCFTGHELVQWLIATDRVANHEQAAAVGQALVDARYIMSPTVTDCVFHDGLVLYRPCASVDVGSVSSGSQAADAESAAAAAAAEQEPKWLQDLEHQDEAAAGLLDKFGNTISSLGTDDVSSKDSMPASSSQSWPDGSTSNSGASATADPWPADVGHVGATVAADQLCEIGEVCPPTFDPDNANSECLMRDRLRDMHEAHLTVLTRQLLSRSGLSLSWTEPLIDMAKTVTHFVKPDVKFNGDRMDVRNYVHIKKLRAGHRLDMDVVYGTVCTKQVVHKRMRTNIVNPSIMLLQSSIEYQRVTNKFSSLDPQILQEQEYLGNSVSKICKYKPDVLLVEKTVSRIAQELLLEAGITLVLNVKESVMQRVARCTMADIVTSIDGLVNAPVLGKCHQFELKTFKFDDGYFKTLMYFDGCPANLGCTVILRSSSYSELNRVKPVLSFLLYAYHSSTLEMAFMMDQCASVAPVEKDESFLQSITKPAGPGIQRPYSQTHSRWPSGQTKSDGQPQPNEASVLAVKDESCSVDASTDVPRCGQSATVESLLRLADAMPATDCEPTGHPPLETVVPPEESRSVSSAVSAAENVSATDCQLLPAASSQPAATAASQLAAATEAAVGAGVQTVSRPGSFLLTDAVADPLSLVESSESAEAEAESVLRKRTNTRRMSAAFSSGLALGDQPPLPLRRLQTVLADTVLSVSPMVKADLPYFETAAGRCSPLRRFFPSCLYWSPMLEVEDEFLYSTTASAEGKGLLVTMALPRSECFDYKLEAEHLASSSVDVTSPHPLLNAVMQQPDDEHQLQALLASYRAAGCRLKPRSNDGTSAGSTSALSHNDTHVSIAVDIVNDGERDIAPRIDCLDIAHHQRISVLFSSFSHDSANAPELCVNPWVINMHFYGRNDMTLGTFLERYCFRESYYCPSVTCETPMVKHVRRFAHDCGCLHLVMKLLDGDQPVVDAVHILTWSYCRKCKKATAITSMSHSSWSMSFAKYLELRLQAQPIGSRLLPDCRHSLHRDYNQYFRFGRMLASFKYSAVISRELRLPSLGVHFDLKKPFEILKEHVKNLHHKAFSMYTSITEGLCKIRETASDGKKLLIAEIAEEHEQERTEFRDRINSVLTHMSSADGAVPDVKTLLQLSAEAVRLKRNVANAIHEWNQKLQQLVTMKEEKVASLKDDKNSMKESPDRQSSSSKKAADFTVYVPEDGQTAADVDVDEATSQIAPGPTADAEATGSCEILPSTVQEVLCEEPTPDALSTTKPNRESANLSEASGADGVPADCASADSLATLNRLASRTSDMETVCSTTSPSVDTTDGIPIWQRSSSQTPMVDDGQSESLLKRDDVSAGLGRIRRRQPTKMPDNDFKVKTKSGLGFERILSNIFLSDIAQIEVALQIPADQHFLMHVYPDVQALPPLIIYEQEPSSVIAFTMSSVEYKKKVVDLKMQLKAQHPNISFTGTMSPVDPDRPLPESGTAAEAAAATASSFSKTAPSIDSAFKSQDSDFSDFMKDDVDNERFGNRDAERAKMEFLNCHIEMQFTEKASSGDKVAQFYCKVYFAEHFRKLRKLLMPNQEDMFIHSLTRCVTWQAKGGKSGLRFCKTLDDRFILKQLSRYEIQSFLEFAPHYIAYLTDAHNEKKPTALAKIFGIYRIGFRNHATGAAIKQDLLVMENLFYQRTLAKVFDLKGSVRNRLVSTSRCKDEEVVLQDENLLRHIVESPLYVRPHSKTVLQQAVVNDSHFLSSHLIMDYSLLVGIDDQSRELVVGIIDYIRTFTWDKKLEMVVKSSAILGGQGKMPTIVSPEVYRTRFVEAMERYFYLVPDRWSGLADADC